MFYPSLIYGGFSYRTSLFATTYTVQLQLQQQRQLLVSYYSLQRWFILFSCFFSHLIHYCYFRKQMIWMAILGLIGVAINQYLFLYGLSFATATNAVILEMCVPGISISLSRDIRIQ